MVRAALAALEYWVALLPERGTRFLAVFRREGAANALQLVAEVSFRIIQLRRVANDALGQPRRNRRDLSQRLAVLVETRPDKATLLFITIS